MYPLICIEITYIKMIKDNKNNKEHLKNLFWISAEVEKHFKMSHIVGCVTSVYKHLSRGSELFISVNNATSSKSTLT